jgi:hypothetical protein
MKFSMSKFKYAPYSSSKLVVAGCPARFKSQYIDGIKAPGGQRALKGNVIHECFEDLIVRMSENELITTQHVEDLLQEKLKKYNITTVELVNECRLSVHGFMEVNDFPVDLSTLVGTEEMLAVKKNDQFEWIQCDWDDPEAIYRGKIDVLCVDDQSIGTIVDHKTQKNKERDANTFQMSTYAFLVMKCYPDLKGVRAIIHYADYNLKTFSEPYEFTKADIDAVEEKILGEINLIEALSDYTANIAGDVCNYCPKILECEIYQKELTLAEKNLGSITNAPITSATMARDFAETVTVLEKILASAKKSLNQFCKGYETSVVIKGREYGFFSSMKWEPKTNKDKEKILELLKENGEDPMNYCTIDMRALKKSYMFLNKQPLEEIRDHMRKVYSTSFRGRKI